MISIILAAGSGTRMRPLSYYIPKILLPVRGKPVLNYLFNNMNGLDISTHYIIVSENMEIIERYVSKMRMDNVKLIRGLGWETGGDLSIALEQIEEVDDAIVMNGDIVTDLKMSLVYDDHKRADSFATIAIFSLENEEEARRFGVISLDDSSFITRFDEKSQSKAKGPVLVNTGFYIFGKRLIENRMEYLIPRKFKLELELFPRLAAERKLLGSKRDVDYWWDVGTFESYLKAEKYFVNGKGVIPPE